MDVSSLRATAFWGNVWQCTHKHPCKRCCWPWKGIDVSLNWKYVWHEDALYPDYDRVPARYLAVYRLAYALTYGDLLPWSRAVHLCHQCHFRPCCNPSHLIPGSSSDNIHDKRRARLHRAITLPDGCTWTYADACTTQEAFYEAQSYCRVWAGPIPAHFLFMADSLHTPTLWAHYADRFPPDIRSLYTDTHRA